MGQEDRGSPGDLDGRGDPEGRQPASVTAQSDPRLRRPLRHWRWWLVRALALCVGLVPLAACEAILRAIDWPRPDLYDDPFVGFSAVRPLFVLDPTGTRYEIPPGHSKFFCPDAFDAVKPPGEFRIFCLGGSTVQGRPFAKETSYTTWLELSLKAADPSRPWRVVNCGGTSYASYRLVEVEKEILGHAPDLIVIDMGHNEFLEDRTYSQLKRVPRPVRRSLGLVSRLRTFALLQSAMVPGPKPSAGVPKPMLGPEVQAILDYEGGLSSYHHDDAWQSDVIEHFEFNLRRMIALAYEARVPVILINPVYDLDIPPFKAEHGPGITDEDRRRFEALRDAARERYGNDLPGAIARLRAAIAINGEHAGVHYELAKLYQQAGRTDEARKSFIAAKDNDVCPLRILEPMSRALLEIGRETNTPVVDLAAIFRERSGGKILGDEWLVDHVHPSIQGHQLVANVLLDEMVRERMARPRPGWQAERDRLYQAHLASLDDLYYLMGQKHLGNLRLWAEGRGNMVRPGSRSPGPTTAAQKESRAADSSL